MCVCVLKHQRLLNKKKILGFHFAFMKKQFFGSDKGGRAFIWGMGGLYLDHSSSFFYVFCFFFCSLSFHLSFSFRSAFFFLQASLMMNCFFFFGICFFFFQDGAIAIGETAMHLACKNGMAKTVHLLLQKRKQNVLSSDLQELLYAEDSQV